MGTAKKAEMHRIFIGISTKICSQSAHIWSKEFSVRRTAVVASNCGTPWAHQCTHKNEQTTQWTVNILGGLSCWWLHSLSIGWNIWSDVFLWNDATIQKGNSKHYKEKVKIDINFLKHTPDMNSVIWWNWNIQLYQGLLCQKRNFVRWRISS